VIKVFNAEIADGTETNIVDLGDSTDSSEDSEPTI